MQNERGQRRGRFAISILREKSLKMSVYKVVGEEMRQDCMYRDAIRERMERRKRNEEGKKIQNKLS